MIKKKNTTNINNKKGSCPENPSDIFSI